MSTVIDGSSGITFPGGSTQSKSGQGPAFSVYRNSGQTVSTMATIAADAEQYDTHNAVASGVFTAPVAGYYMFVGMCANSTTPCLMTGRFKKNASEYYYGVTYPTGNVNSTSVTAIIYLALNDTVEFQVQQSTSQSISTGLGGNYFQGCMLRAA